MAKVAIRIAESALADLEAIRTWYAEQNVPELGERLIGDNRREHRGTRRSSGHGAYRPRARPAFSARADPAPFRIVYRRDPKHVRVVRVWRSERLLDVPDENSPRSAAAADYCTAVIAARRSKPPLDRDRYSNTVLELRIALVHSSEPHLVGPELGGSGRRDLVGGRVARPEGLGPQSGAHVGLSVERRMLAHQGARRTPRLKSPHVIMAS